MKIANNKADAFARAPDKAVRAVLVYGPDAGLVRERAGALVQAVAEDPSDPFRVADLAPSRLKDDPALLSDEAAALSFTGGRRVLRVEGATDELAPLFDGFLADAAGDALVVIQAGDLPGRSKLRKIFEGAAQGAALACYRDDGRTLQALVQEMLRSAGLSASKEAIDYLGANLGGDRQLTRRELEKLILYKAGSSSAVEIEDVLGCVGDSAMLGLEDLAFAVGDGDLPEVERGLARALDEGIQPIAVLRAVARHFGRLHFVSGTVSMGSGLDDAVKRLRPPLFWKTSDRFKGQCRRWPARGLAQALERLIEVEAACKQTGAPARILAARALLGLAASARRAR